MNRVAVRERFLVLYPEQDRTANAQGCWNWYGTRTGRPDREADSIDAAITQICLTQPVDSERIAVAGLSAGASMATLLETGIHLPALLVIHGIADHVVAPSNGAEFARLWAEIEGAKPGVMRSVQRGVRHAMKVIDYRAPGRLVATLCEVSGLGHAWSGGAASQSYSDPRGPDATRMICSFAAKRFATVQA
jgi:poly(3-hydroxybutyrate) depolymerase